MKKTSALCAFIIALSAHTSQAMFRTALAPFLTKNGPAREMSELFFKTASSFVRGIKTETQQLEALKESASQNTNIARSMPHLAEGATVVGGSLATGYGFAHLYEKARDKGEIGIPEMYLSIIALGGTVLFPVFGIMLSAECMESACAALKGHAVRPPNKALLSLGALGALGLAGYGMEKYSQKNKH